MAAKDPSPSATIWDSTFESPLFVGATRMTKQPTALRAGTVCRGRGEHTGLAPTHFTTQLELLGARASPIAAA